MITIPDYTRTVTGDLVINTPAYYKKQEKQDYITYIKLNDDNVIYLTADLSKLPTSANYEINFTEIVPRNWIDNNCDIVFSDNNISNKTEFDTAFNAAIADIQAKII